VTQTFGVPGSLDASWHEARSFYGILLGSLALASMLAFVGVAPIALLYWASVAGGLATPLTLWLLLAVATNRAIVGENRIGPWHAASGAVVAAIVTASCAVFLVSLL
jgi:Mn2+/Fe2+ NRAMP family transporter